MAQNHFKIVLVGNSAVGKTAFIERHISGKFVSEYTPTIGVDVRQLVFKTNYGYVNFDVWDCAGKKEFEGLGDGYYINADGCIAMFSVTSKVSYTDIPSWINVVNGVVGKIPTIVCGNFTDKLVRAVSPKSITIHHNNGADSYFDVSAKSTYNYEKPFLFLARALMKKTDLHFVAI